MSAKDPIPSPAPLIPMSAPTDSQTGQSPLPSSSSSALSELQALHNDNLRRKEEEESLTKTKARYKTIRNRVGLLILAAAYSFLYPGLFWPTCHVRTGIFDTLTSFDRSTIQLVTFLYQQGPMYYPPAILLTIFSVSLPFIKGFLILIGLYRNSARLLWFVARISKYQFVDTYSIMMSYVFLNDPAITTELRDGVYYFLGYCCLSVLGTQVICYGYESDKSKSVKTLWLPVALIQVVALINLYWLSPFLGVHAVLFNRIRLIGTRASLGDIIAVVSLNLIGACYSSVQCPYPLPRPVIIFSQMNPFLKTLMFLTLVVIPMITYVILPICIRFQLPNRSYFKTKENLKSWYTALDFLHDWSMGDVWLISFIVSWLSFNAADEVTCEVIPIGTYFTILYGTSGVVLMFIYEWNFQLRGEKLPESRERRRLREVRERMEFLKDQLRKEQLQGQQQQQLTAAPITVENTMATAMPAIAITSDAITVKQNVPITEKKGQSDDPLGASEASTTVSTAGTTQSNMSSVATRSELSVSVATVDRNGPDHSGSLTGSTKGSGPAPVNSGDKMSTMSSVDTVVNNQQSGLISPSVTTQTSTASSLLHEPGISSHPTPSSGFNYDLNQALSFPLPDQLPPRASEIDVLAGDDPDTLAQQPFNLDGTPRRKASRLGRVLRYFAMFVIFLGLPTAVMLTLQSSQKPTIPDVKWINDAIKASPMVSTVNGMLSGKKIASSVGCCQNPHNPHPVKGGVCSDHPAPMPCKPISSDAPLTPLFQQKGDWYIATVRWISGIENVRINGLELIPGDIKPNGNETKISVLSDRMRLDTTSDNMNNDIKHSNYGSGNAISRKLLGRYGTRDIADTESDSESSAEQISDDSKSSFFDLSSFYLFKKRAVAWMDEWLRNNVLKLNSDVRYLRPQEKPSFADIYSEIRKPKHKESKTNSDESESRTKSEIDANLDDNSHHKKDDPSPGLQSSIVLKATFHLENYNPTPDHPIPHPEVTLPLSLQVESPSIGIIQPQVLIDNNHSCCTPKNVSLSLVADCYGAFPYIRNVRTGNITISPDIAIDEEVLGYKIQLYDLNSKILSVVHEQLDKLIHTFNFSIGHTPYNVTGLINTIVDSNMPPNSLLTCPNGTSMDTMSRRSDNNILFEDEDDSNTESEAESSDNDSDDDTMWI